MLIATSYMTLIVGLGITGFSVARYLTSKNRLFIVADRAPKPETLKAFNEQFPDIKVLTGEFLFKDWQGIQEIILSPGVPRRHPAVAEAISLGIPVIGDVELFAREATVPIVAITGANGKTTVTALFEQMAKEAGKYVKAGGNIGVPALDLLDPKVDLYVLELSSFQLESTFSLKAAAATVLNVTPDHMDRYDSLQEYTMTKQRIYRNAKTCIVNADDILTVPPMGQTAHFIRFTSKQPDLKEFGICRDGEDQYLCFGQRRLIAASAMKLRGAHNLHNALAALALGHAIGLNEMAMLNTLQKFAGLPHRCEWVGVHQSVTYINDSKATNVGAAEAALKGLAATYPNIILIAGGDGKGAHFSMLKSAIDRTVKFMVLIGRDAPIIAAECGECVPYVICKTLNEAVKQAAMVATAGDLVLLSPACASLDMFLNYEDRGQQFRKEVQHLCQS